MRGLCRIMEEVVRKCSTCGGVPPAVSFYADARKRQCRVCIQRTNKNGLRRNPEHAAEVRKKWYAANRERVQEINRASTRRKDPTGARQKARDTAYRARNIQLVRFRANLRRARQMGRLPKWADLEAIKQIYLGCPVDLVVDHIYPLQGLTCSGLHVADNLQYLTPRENGAKANQMPKDAQVEPLFEAEALKACADYVVRWKR